MRIKLQDLQHWVDNRVHSREQSLLHQPLHQWLSGMAEVRLTTIEKNHWGFEPETNGNRSPYLRVRGNVLLWLTSHYHEALE